MKTVSNDGDVLQIDIVSDVMCPWCIVGYRQLEQALRRLSLSARLRWHPFELNPDMSPGGQNLGEHIAAKYGATPEQSRENRKRLARIGESLGIVFRFDDDSRIVNSFLAHQLLDWADEKGLQHPLMLALFEAHFTAGLDVSDPQVLTEVAGRVGLDTAGAAQVLASGERAARVRENERFWTSRGITGVPSMIFGGRFLLTGAQGVDTYARMLERARDAGAAA
ncbi:DsbA family oxidoreductase [Sulfitobacter sp. LCG007]